MTKRYKSSYVNIDFTVFRSKERGWIMEKQLGPCQWTIFHLNIWVLCVWKCGNPPKFSGSSIFVITFFLGISMWGHNPFSHKPLSKSSPCLLTEEAAKWKTSSDQSNWQIAIVQARPWSFIFWYKMENLKEDFFQISTGHDSWKEHLMKTAVSGWCLSSHPPFSCHISITSIPSNYHRIRSMTPMELLWIIDDPHIPKNS